MSARSAGVAEEIAARLAAVRERMDTAAQRSGRSPADVTLVAVSKTFPPDQVRAVLDGGVRDLGENRIQEAEGKIAALPAGIDWHLIGHLQSNKVGKALDLFSLVHSVDSVELAQAIGARAARLGRRARVLLQINVAGKETQFGFAEAALRAQAPRIAPIEGLSLEGLMCIAPETDDPEAARPSFRRLAALFRELAPAMAGAGHQWRHLSMGMTNDYPVAIEEGATLVRVGRAIFGERTPVAAGQG